MKALALFAACLFAGCAGTTIKPVTDDTVANGIRYYEPAPFLLVTPDGRGNISSRIIYLPDLTELRSVDPFAYMAKNNTTLTFSNGMLVQNKSIIDETAIATQVFDSLKTSAGTIGAALDAPDGEPTLPGPRLFRIWTDPQTGEATLIEARTQGDTAIRIKVTAKQEAKQ